MSKAPDKASNAKRPKPPPRRGKPQPTGNPRLAEQTRKILGKHYASKYRVR